MKFSFVPQSLLIGNARFECHKQCGVILSSARIAAPKWIVYKARIPLIGMPKFVNIPLHEIIVLVDGTNNKDESHGEHGAISPQNGFLTFDFIPMSPRDPATLILLSLGFPQPGRVREKVWSGSSTRVKSDEGDEYQDEESRESTRTVRKRKWILVGRTTKSIDEIRRFNAKYPAQLHFYLRNCYHYTRDLIKYCEIETIKF